VADKISNEFLLEEVRLNRREIVEVRNIVGGKVSWGNLFSVLSLIGMVIATVLILL
jgi:hypothetical protein